MTLAPENRKVCSGWQAAVARLKEKGFFANKDYLFIRRVVGQRALILLERMLNKATSKPDRKKAQRDLTECVQFIKTKDIGPLEIPL